MELFFKHKRWLWPLLFAIALAPLTPWIDLSLARYFYQHGNDAATHFMTSPFIDFMYMYGYWVPNFFACGAVILLLFARWRNPALVIVLTMIVGGGLITHALLKEYWGRPRPKQIEAFGGNQTYRPFWSPHFNNPEPSKSFVSGHALTGFLFLTLVLLGQRYQAPLIVATGWVLTLVFATSLAYTRLAQGGHFFSDILFSGLIMWWTALSMEWLVYAHEDAH